MGLIIGRLKMFKDIIKALLLHKESLPSFDDWDGLSKSSISVESLTITFKANKQAIDRVIAKYEKGNVLSNFQNKLEWARRDTRNYSQRPLKNN
jgi:hypothetical protein